MRKHHHQSVTFVTASASFLMRWGHAHHSSHVLACIIFEDLIVPFSKLLAGLDAICDPFWLHHMDDRPWLPMEMLVDLGQVQALGCQNMTCSAGRVPARTFRACLARPFLDLHDTASCELHIPLHFDVCGSCLYAAISGS